MYIYIYIYTYIYMYMYICIYISPTQSRKYAPTSRGSHICVDMCAYMYRYI